MVLSSAKLQTSVFSININNLHDVTVVSWRQSIYLIKIRKKFNVYVVGDNVDVYVEIFLTTVHGFQSLIINTERIVLLRHNIMDIIFWDFLIVEQIFFSPQVKRSGIISNKHRKYELPHELPNNLKRSIL